MRLGYALRTIGAATLAELDLSLLRYDRAALEQLTARFRRAAIRWA